MTIYRGPGGTGDSTASASGDAAIASTAAANAAASAAAAAISATSAGVDAGTAQNAANNAANSQTAAATSAGNAATSATNSANSATAALASQTAAALSEANTASIYDDFDDRYLGTKTTSPAFDNDGNTLEEGALYFNTTTHGMYVWNSSLWVPLANEISSTAAAASAAAALASQNAAATSASNAATSATNASNSASTASTQASNASSSASAASTSASNASSSASSASSSASTATTQASNASTSASNAASSASSASSSASTATTQAGIATTQATNAASSASSAASSLASVQTIFDNFDDIYLGAKASDPTVDNDGDPLNAGDIYWNTTESEIRFYNGTAWERPEYSASQSAINAANSASAASTSASNALTSENNAETAETNAIASANLANDWATKTSGPVAGGEYSSKYNAQQAATSASNASTSASNASTSASNASTSASNAATSASNAAASYDSFDDRYLGAKSSAPTLDNDGNALLTGAIYWNSTGNALWVWDGSSWLPAAFSSAGNVTSFNTRTGAITLTSSDVTTALTYTPVTNARTLTINGTAYDLTADRSWTIDTLPSQTSNSGKFLTTNGTSPSWATVDALPSQTSNSGKYLKTDGTSASWDALDISTADITGTLPVANGGTGQTTASAAFNALSPLTTAGDILYGATSGAGTRLGIGTVGQVLSVSVGGLPTWSTISAGLGTVTSVGLSAPSIFTVTNSPVTSSGTLTLSYSGTALPVANGGTGTSTAFTTGSIVFAGASGTYTQDNANLFWDDTNNRLGIGTSSPTALLDVNGNLAITGTARRITGDFSNATLASRVAFQTSTTNGATRLMVIPNGTSDVAAINCINNSDPTNASWASFQVQQSSDVRIQSAIAGTGTYLPMTFYTGGSERMRIDTSGNVGIGKSPLNESNRTYLQVYNATEPVITVSNSTMGSNFAGIRAFSSDFYIDNANNGALIFRNQTGYTERMRIDSSGRVGINTNSPTAMLHINSDSDSITPARFNVTTAGATSKNCVIFQREGTNVGFITVTNAATAYVTSSDYRLKENIVPMTGALDKVAQLKPVTYKWKIDGSDGQGFIAHELQAIVPDCVYGEKDAIDTEGNPEYQGVDTSFLVATLTAAIQELKAIVDAQQQEINELKANNV